MSEEFSPEQVAALRGASPEELHFLIMFARNYVGGRKFLCWGARALVALGMLAGALAAIAAFLNSVSRFKY